MSATNRGAQRVELDFYGTPDWCTYALLKKLGIPLDAHVLEPGCGDGAILRELARWGYKNVTGIETDPERARRAHETSGYTVLETNYLDPDKAFGTYDFIPGNPPYSLAMDFVLQSLQHVKPVTGCVAMLLRLNWLSSMVRAPFHRATPAHVYVLPKRPSFCISMTCKEKKTCGWQKTISPEANRFPFCPLCEGDVSVVTTDATEYGWFVWGGPGYVPGKWEIL